MAGGGGGQRWLKLFHTIKKWHIMRYLFWRCVFEYMHVCAGAGHISNFTDNILVRRNNDVSSRFHVYGTK